MTRHIITGRAVALALLTMIAAACDNPTEPGESGTRYDPSETATETREGVTLVISYDSSSERFDGTVTNNNDTTVTDVRVEIHLSNGTELGPTPRVDLAAGESKPVTLDASGESFTWYSVHVELGSGSG